jgi:hypothetical protein
MPTKAGIVLSSFDGNAASSIHRRFIRNSSMFALIVELCLDRKEQAAEAIDALIAMNIRCNRRRFGTKQVSITLGEHTAPFVEVEALRKGSMYMVICKQKVRLFAVVGVVIATTLTMGVGPADSPLVFVDEEPLTLTWEKAKVGDQVVVCNLGQDPLQDLQAKLIGFNFPKDNADILQPPEGPNFQDTLTSDQCTSVQIKAQEGAELSTAEYKGGLVGSAAGIDEIVRNITIQVPKPTVKGVVDNVVLTSRRWSGFFSAKHTEDFRLYLKLEGEGDLPSDLYSESDAGDKAIGVVSSEDSPAYLYVNGKPNYSRRTDGVVTLPIEVRELGKVGTYAGSLREPGSGVKIEVRVTHAFYWALAAILLGTAIAFLLLLWRQRWNPKSQLKQRCSDLVRNYRTAERHFQRWFENYKNRALEGNQSYTVVESIGKYKPDEDSVVKYQRDFWREFERYAQDNWLFDTSKDDFKKLVKTLETAESDAQQFGEQKGTDGRSDSRFGGSLKDLGAALESFDKFLRKEYGEERTPALVKPAANLLKGGPLAVGAVQKITTQAKEYVTLIENWRKMAIEIKQYTLWYIRIWATQGMTPRHREMLERAGARLIEAKNEMMDAKDTATLANLGTAEDLKRAYGTLAYLGSLYGVWEAPEAQKEQEQREEGAVAIMLLQKEEVKISEFASVYTDSNQNLVETLPDPQFDEWLNEAKYVPLTSEKVARIERNRRWLGNVIALGLILLIGILPLLLQAYSDKPWGTLRDYVAAFLLGAGAAVVAQFSDTVKQLWGRLKS